ncbi:MAG: FAD-dependent oxidoreductase [Phycisphaerae bacterium]|nr:FAD-dependent oxidoreductase [Phycisphaerae bacterium]
MQAETSKFDVVVVGAGSAGIGASVAAARAGLSVLLLEKDETIGGTAVRSGVSTWEPDAGGKGIPHEIYRRLTNIPNSVGIYSVGKSLDSSGPDGPKFIGGECLIEPNAHYRDTLLRSGSPDGKWNYSYVRKHWFGVVFEPYAYLRVVGEMLDETGCCTVRTNTSFSDVQVEAGRILSLRLNDGSSVVAEAYVDCTGDGHLCTACKCETMWGQEPKDRFDEPDASTEPAESVNGVTLIYRITRANKQAVEPLPRDVPADCWWREDFPIANFVQMSCGDYLVNMLPTLEGREFINMKYEAACVEARRRVRTHWHYVQEALPKFRQYRLSWIAPALGVRETTRIVGQYVLTEHDLLAGLSGQTHEDIIAIADHAMDTHGQSGRGCVELTEPYGIPYRCLIPKGFRNLLIACRGASFSSIAASSCRLSRVMMNLGWAAGNAVTVARKMGADLPDVPVNQISTAS